MKFIVDAQLPAQLASAIKNAGFDALHTDDLPNKDHTTDDEIRQISIIESRIVITKDSDFSQSNLIQNVPAKILFINTGNIKNKFLALLFQTHFQEITRYFERYDFIELSQNGIILHEKT